MEIRDPHKAYNFSHDHIIGIPPRNHSTSHSITSVVARRLNTLLCHTPRIRQHSCRPAQQLLIFLLRIVPFRQQQMEHSMYAFAQLLRRRLTIANSAAQSDPQLNDSVKGVLAVMAECFSQQATSMELIQAQLADKVGSSQFKQITGQKLSLRQFLAYFQKKMQNHWASTQTRTNESLQTKLDASIDQLNTGVSMRLDELKKELYQRFSHLQQRNRDIEEYTRRMSLLKDEIQRVSQNCASRQQQVRRKVNEKLAQTKEEILRSCSSSEKLSAVVGQIKCMQTYFNQTHQELALLIKSLAQDNRTQSTIAPQIITHIAALETMIGGIQKGMPGRWFWQSRPGDLGMHWEQMGGSNWVDPKTFGPQAAGIRIERAGLHRLVVGYVLQSQLQGELRVSVQGEQILCLALQGQRQRGLCRSSMLFVYLGGGSNIYLSVNARCGATGFLQLQHL